MPQPHSAALGWAPCWPVACHEKEKCSILTHIRGDIMGVFLADKKPTGQMEMEEETLRGNQQKFWNHQAGTGDHGSIPFGH